MAFAHLAFNRLRRSLDPIVTGWQTLVGMVSDPYRPEQHYMRGPGPKWRARHRAGSRAR